MVCFINKVLHGLDDLFNFATWGGSKEMLLLGSAQCSKKIDDGPINMAP